LTPARDLDTLTGKEVVTMLRLDYEQYDAAAEKMAKALQRAEDTGMRTFLGRAQVMLEALGADFDVDAMDVRDDVGSGEVWGDVECADENCSCHLPRRAIEAALAVAPQTKSVPLFFDFRVPKMDDDCIHKNITTEYTAHEVSEICADCGHEIDSEPRVGRFGGQA